MGSIRTVIAREIREALPATLFFLVLFHLIGLTKAVILEDYSFTALRAAGATVGALIVAKAILLVDALPLSRLSSGKRMVQVLWKTVLYSAVTLLFRFAEELIPLVSAHGGVVPAARAMADEVSWPLFAVLSLWVFGGLFLYALASELVESLGPDKVRAMLFGGDEAPRHAP